MRRRKWIMGVLILIIIASLFFYVCIFPIGREKYAVVSGQSITGMMAAIILAHSGYRVDTYDIRENYTRNIQWAGRQSLVDELASLDLEMANRFLEQVARPIYRGSIHLKPGGYRRQKKRDDLRIADPKVLPKSGEEMMSYPSIINMEARVFETFLKAYLSTLPHVHLHVGKMKLEKRGESFALSERVPDLIVIAEGANSSTRKELGIKSIPITPERMQIAGVISYDSGGVMIKHWRQEGDEIRLTGVMGRAGVEKTWIVADIDPKLTTSQQSINQEFRRLAGLALELPLEKIDKLPIFGPVDGKAITPFFLKESISDTAFCGDNVVLMGDAVGTGHWSVGGGMQVGAVCHAERLKTLLQDLDSKMTKKEALMKYSEGVLNDTVAWEESSFKDSLIGSQDESNWNPLIGISSLLFSPVYCRSMKKRSTLSIRTQSSKS